MYFTFQCQLFFKNSSFFSTNFSKNSRTQPLIQCRLFEEINQLLCDERSRSLTRRADASQGNGLPTSLPSCLPSKEDFSSRICLRGCPVSGLVSRGSLGTRWLTPKTGRCHSTTVKPLCLALLALRSGQNALQIPVRPGHHLLYLDLSERTVLPTAATASHCQPTLSSPCVCTPCRYETLACQYGGDE